MIGVVVRIARDEIGVVAVDLPSESSEVGRSLHRFAAPNEALIRSDEFPKEIGLHERGESPRERCGDVRSTGEVLEDHREDFGREILQKRLQDGESAGFDWIARL